MAVSLALTPQGGLSAPLGQPSAFSLQPSSVLYSTVHSPLTSVPANMSKPARKPHIIQYKKLVRTRAQCTIDP